MLTEKDYCDYETCVALYELGCVTHPYDNTDTDKVLQIVHLYDAQKWLREEHDIHIEPFLCNFEYTQYKLNIVGKPKGNTCYCSIYNSLMEDIRNKTNTYFNSYEEALLEGIKEAVKLLKEERK